MRYWSAERRNVSFIGRGSSSFGVSFSHFTLSINLGPHLLPIPAATQTLWHIATKDTSVKLIYDFSLKERRKGVKGHLKDNMNGEAFWVSLLCYTKEVMLQTARLISVDLSEGWSEAFALAIDSSSKTPLRKWKSMISGGWQPSQPLTHYSYRVFPKRTLTFYTLHT